MAYAMKRRQRNGLSILEMAIVAPMMLLLIFGVIEFSWMYLKASDISTAAREGARYAITTAVTDSSQLSASNSPAMKVLDQAHITGATIECPTGVAVGTGNPVTVHVWVPYDSVKLIGMIPGPASGRLEATVTMLREGM